MLPALIVVFACTLSGVAVLSCLGIRAENGPQQWAMSFLSGSLVLSLWAMLGTAIGVWSGPLWLAIGLGVPLGLAVLLRRKPALKGWSHAWLGFLPCLALVAMSLWLASTRPVFQVDAMARWVMHGQWLAQTGSLLPELVADPVWAFTHPRYPPLVPSLVGFGLHLGADLEFGLRPLFPFFFAALLAVLYGHAHRRLGQGWAAAISFALGSTPAYLYLDRLSNTGGLGADSATADIPLAAFLTAAAVCFLQARRERSRPQLALAVSMVCAAALTKNEGIPAAACLLAVSGCAAWLDRKRWPVSPRLHGLGFLPLIAAVALWQFLCRSMPIAEGEDYLNWETLSRLPSGLERLPVILAEFGRQTVNFPLWGPTWLMAVLAVGAALALRFGQRDDAPKSRHDREFRLVSLWLIGSLAVLVLPYLVTGWRGGDYETLLKGSLARLLTHHAPLAPLLLLSVSWKSVARTEEIRA